MIRLEGVSREFRTGHHVVHALRGLDLYIPAGQFVVLMGPSGSGKSTLLNVIGCLDRPTAGRYWLDGRETTALPDTALVEMRRHKLGFIFQTFHLVPRMNAARNVELPMVFAGIDSGERRSRAGRSLEAVGLAERVTHRPDELSGGERQRVAIARALVMDPPVLLADEPTGNLDTTSGAEIVKILGDLNRKGRTIVMVTHNEQLASVGHRLVRLRDGRIEHDGKP
jgi:putative ABC transport system ATP-binding protein